MKKEILSLHNISGWESETAQLKHVSFDVFAGECAGLLGLANSGIGLLVSILNGDAAYTQGEIDIGGKVIRNRGEIKKYVYKITPNNYQIDNWNVAEYVSLVDSDAPFGILRSSAILEETQVLFEDLALNINVATQLKALTDLERRLVDVAKAIRANKRILIIEDEFEGCTTKEIKRFKEFLAHCEVYSMAAILYTHSDNVSQTLSDKYIIFKKGTIVKKCDVGYIENNRHLEKFLLGNTITTQKKELEITKTDPVVPGQLVYSLKNLLTAGGRSLDLNFYRGEVATILARTSKAKEQVFGFLSGRLISGVAQIWLEGQFCQFNSISDFVRAKIVSAAHLGETNELLPLMTPGENLAIPSLGKIPPWEYYASSHKLGKVLVDQVNGNLQANGKDLRDMEANDCIILVLERWYVYRPKVLVLFEPFVHCDLYGVSLIQAYIRKFTAMGTSVIVVKSRKEYIEEISHRTILID